MIKGEEPKLKEIADNNVCAEHKQRLEVAWHSGDKCWVIRCGSGEYPDAVTRQLTAIDEVKQGQHEDVARAIATSKKHEVMERKPGASGEVLSAIGAPDTDLYTGEKLPFQMVGLLIQYAYRYQLDPARGHVTIYHGHPYITIDGYLFHANRSNIPYTLKSQPMTTEEIKQFKVGADDHAWIADVNLLDSNAHFTGIGIVTADELTEKSKKDPEKLRSPVVAKHPQLLAQKRAEWQVLRRAFPIGESEEE